MTSQRHEDASGAPSTPEPTQSLIRRIIARQNAAQDETVHHHTFRLVRTHRTYTITRCDCGATTKEMTT